MSNSYTSEEAAMVREIKRLRDLVNYQHKVLETVNEWLNKTDSIKPDYDISSVRRMVKESVS